MFIDRAKITVRSGKGGDGHVGFRREKYVPKGGPDGGNGGRGGSVYLRADVHLTTLEKFRYQPLYRAPDGEAGGRQRRTGADGADLVVNCPPGTQVYKLPEEVLLADLDEAGEQVLLAAGGRGGLGNSNFATPTRQTPRFATPGRPGEVLELRLELKVLADVGLAGMPNAGKSSLLARLSNARPRVAAYPFTTLSPHLGVVTIDRDRGFVMADVPGLIDGAGEGAGLGHDFLRHLERTRVIVVVVDAAATEGREPLEDYRTVRRELRAFSPELDERVGLVCANKTELPDSEECVARLRAELELPVIAVSAATGAGCDELKKQLARLLGADGLWHEDAPAADDAFDPLAGD